MFGIAILTAEQISLRFISIGSARRLIKIVQSSLSIRFAARDTAWGRRGHESQNTPSPDDVAFLHRRRSAAGFNRFYRAAYSNSGEAQSGGLAIAQAIAIAQGGTIECESTVGVGSTFPVALPITRPQEAVLETLPKQKLILL